MTKHLGRSWEYIFSKCLPDRIDILAETFGNVLRSFRDRMNERARLMKAPSFALAARQVKILEASLRDTTALKAMITTGQKEASRLMVPIIGEAMAGGYANCVAESGKRT